MQYLLSEAEYLALTGNTVEAAQAQADLQAFCTMVANKLPMNAAGRGTGHLPHGCILCSGVGLGIYCNTCPCLTVCPSDKKRLLNEPT